MRMVKYWFLEDSFNMMRRVGMFTMMRLCELLEMKTFKKGSRIHEDFKDDHLIYFIKKGHVKIGKQVGEEFHLEQVLKMGNIFGESRVTTGEDPEPYTAIAMSNCVICFIEEDRMEELMERYPKLHSSILKISGLKFRRIERRLTDILYKDAEARIKDFIYDFVQENGKLDDGWMVTPNIFTHKDIAKLTSTSRQTVNNVITKLRKKPGFAYSRQEIKTRVLVTNPKSD